MAKFAVICSLVVVACLGLSYAAPLDSQGPKGIRSDMAEKFVEFMKQDEQLSSLLAQMGNSHEGLVRQRRADNTYDVEGVDDTTVASAGEGFFDRAAKFVMEVLQRFLGWINSND